jgi:hypothetical protein
MRKPIAVGFLSLLAFVVTASGLMPTKASSQSEPPKVEACANDQLRCEYPANNDYDDCIARCRTINGGFVPAACEDRCDQAYQRGTSICRFQFERCIMRFFSAAPPQSPEPESP